MTQKRNYFCYAFVVMGVAWVQLASLGVPYIHLVIFYFYLVFSHDFCYSSNYLSSPALLVRLTSGKSGRCLDLRDRI